jgi:hypothetical protein
MAVMAMKLRAETLRSEMSQILDIISKWKERLEEGIPGEDLPANDLDAEVFEMQLRGELMLAANRLTSIVEVLDE